MAPSGHAKSLEIISEASGRIPDDPEAKHPEIPWRDIASIGNIPRQGYDTLDHAIIRESWRLTSRRRLARVAASA